MRKYICIAFLVMAGCKIPTCYWDNDSKMDYGKVIQLQYLPSSTTDIAKTIVICERGTVILNHTKPITLGEQASTKKDNCGRIWFSTDFSNDASIFLINGW